MLASYTYALCMQDRSSKASTSKVRKQLLLTREQNASLKAAAAATSRSEGDLVREAIDQWLASQKADEDDWKNGLRQLCGMWKDRTDLDELYAEQRRKRAEHRDRMNRRMRGEEP